MTLSTNTALNRHQLRMFSLFSTRDSQRLSATALKEKDAAVRFQTATTLGRLDVANFADSIAALIQALPEPDLFVRHAIEKALNRLGRANSTAWKQIAFALTNNHPDVRASVSYAMRETYDPVLSANLRELIQAASTPPFAREAAIQSLAAITRKLPEWKGEWWAYHPALAPTPKKTESWQATESIRATLKKVLADDPQLRLTTIRALTKNHETSLAPDLRDLYAKDDHAEVRNGILHALATFHDTNSAQLVLTALQSSNPQLAKEALTLARHSKSTEVLTNIASLISNADNSDLLLEAINISAHLRNGHALPAINAAATNSSDFRIRSAAINALGKIGGPQAAKTLLSLFDLPAQPDLHLQAAIALAEIKDRRAVPKLLSLYSDAPTRDAALEALLRFPDSSAVPAYIDALGHTNPTTRDRARKILEDFRDEALPVIQSRIPTMRPLQIAEIERIYPDRPDLTLLTREKVIPTVADYVNFALTNRGDSTRGRRLFFSESGVACIKCHTVAGEGSAVGPDMTTIGAQFPRDALIEHIVNPSKSVREGYQQVLIETSDDESIAGLIKSESADTLTLLTAQAKLQTIPKSKIASRHSSQLSLMPDGLHLGLSLQEFADLIAYLESLKTAPVSNRSR